MYLKKYCIKFTTGNEADISIDRELNRNFSNDIE